MTSVDKNTSKPLWVTFTDEESGGKVHLNLILFNTLQEGRHLGYVREALFSEPTTPAQIVEEPKEQGFSVELEPEFNLDDPA